MINSSRWLMFLQPQPRDRGKAQVEKEARLKSKEPHCWAALSMTHNYVMTSRAVKGWALMRMSPQGLDLHLGANADCNQATRNWVETHDYRPDNNV